ncbi:MAG TPA: hypothetical protein VHF25_11485 [Nitriliruptorales bacterium]|nr:hypothetical protein [Nitriliruptorales bacterium]
MVAPREASHTWLSRGALLATLALGAACGGGGEQKGQQQPDIGAEVGQVATEGAVPTAEPTGPFAGEGVFETADPGSIGGQPSFIGQDVILTGQIAQVTESERIIFLTAMGGGKGGEELCLPKVGEHDGKLECLLAVLDAGIDTTKLNLEVGRLVQVAGHVKEFSAEGVQQDAGGDTGRLDLEQYQGQGYLLVVIIETGAKQSS